MKTRTNPYLKRIASLVRQNQADKALQLFVAANRRTDESLYELARRLGVSRIIKQTMPFEGGLFRLPDGELVIKLNAQSSFVRQQFTLAHEIGHLLLRTVPAFRSGQKVDPDLERTCDLIAAELLMPTEEATDFVHGLGSPSPENLKVIASRYVVSLQTAAIRVYSGLKLWKCGIGMWSLSPKTKTVWFVGPKRWDNVMPAPSLLERAIASNESFKTTDLWRRREVSETVLLDLLRNGAASAIGLVHFVN
jgi:Zn-dependent peptidase ImmA (M78 family)